MIDYVKTSHNLFGNVSRRIKFYFLDTKEELQRASLNYTLEEYLSVMLFTSTIMFVVENIILAFIFGLLFSPVVAVFLSFTLSIAISGLMFFLFYSYPSTIARSKEKSIKKTLPFATSYLSTISSGKLSPIILFRTLAKFEEYGELARESGNIARNVELFGMTLSAAIKKQARRTPSKEFSELLWGINTVISSGGNLTDFLKEKGEEFMSDYRRRIRKYAQDLSLFVEIYLTLIITGSIFFIVLSSIIATLSSGLGTVVLQTFVVFVLLPLLSVGFIALIKSISPTE